MPEHSPADGSSDAAPEHAPAKELSWTGRALSHYRICEQIGAGGMGVVYRAVDGRLNRSLALKILPPGKDSDPDRRRRFIQEAKAASALNHPNIITIYEVGSEGDVDFIAMEYISGETLERSIYRGEGLATPLILKYAIQMADALSCAHAAGIIHRDLKPANVMVTDKGLVKILDFGLAKLSMEFGDPDLTRSIAPVTVHGMVVGTICYMSPEQAEGKLLDWRSDIFSFGAMLYEMTTQKRPFTGDTPLSTLSAILVKEPAPVVDAIPGVSAGLEELILRCLRKDPSERIQHMDEIKHALESLVQTAGTTVVAPAVRRKPERKLPWKHIAAVAGAGGLLAVGLGLWNGRKPVSGPVEPMLTRLTSETGLAAYPSISADGKLLAYATDRANEGGLDIWVQQIGGGDPIRLTKDEADEYEPEFSRDGTQIVFRSEKDGGGIYVIPALGGSPRLISREGRRPRFSPSAKSIAYWTGFSGPNFHPGATKVFVVPVAGGSPRQVAAEFASARNPVWMADGEHLLVVGRLDTKESLDWWVVPVSGGKPVRTGALALFAASRFLPPPLEYAIVPETAVPDSNAVLFSATLGDVTNVWQIRLDPATGKVTGNPEHLTSGTGLEIEASAGNGRESAPVAFAALTLNVDVFALPLDAQGKPAGEFHPVTSTLSFDAWPDITADGRKLVYVSARPDHGVLKLRNMETGEETVLTTPMKGEIMPKISPDGKRVAYADEKARSGFLVSAEGGVPEKICDRCVLANGWSHDGRRVVFDGGVNGEPLALVDLGTGKRTDYIFSASHRDYMMNACHFSPDDRWVSFHVRKNPLSRQIYVAQVDGDTPPPESRWIPMTDGNAMDRDAAWSADGNTLYFVSDRDGSRCIWAQRLQPSSKLPTGPAFAVQHLHHARRSLTAVGANTGAIGLNAYKGGLVFALGEITGNVWLRQGTSR